MQLPDLFKVLRRQERTWERFYAQWPCTTVLQLSESLPQDFIAEPRVRLGNFTRSNHAEVEELNPKPWWLRSRAPALAKVSALTLPTLTFESNVADLDQFEVLVFDVHEEKRLVAAIEFVSPGNKDRAEHRQAFVAKCLTLLQQGICVSMVDIVTNRRFNLYAEMLAQLGQTDPNLSAPQANIYSVTCRTRPPGQSHLFDSWAYRLAVGEPLPKLPIWLTEDQMLNFDLEASYEATCRALRIGTP